MDSVLREWSGVCPHCDNPIAYIEVILPIDNDKGMAVVTCDKCTQVFLINDIQNAELLTVHRGGRISEYENDLEFDNIEDVYHRLKVLKDPCLFESNSSGFLKKDIFVDLFEGRVVNPFLDPSKEPLYRCSCGNNLEQLSYQFLQRLFKSGDIDRHLNDAWIAHTKGWLLNADKIIIEVCIKCPCSKEYIAIMYSHMFLYSKPPQLDHFLIANVFNAESQKINGIYTKDACKSFVEKYALRWNLLSVQNYVVTAFIGNQYQKADELKSLWKSLSNCFSSEKSLLVTKSSTKKKFEKKINSDGELDILYKYGRVDTLQKNSLRHERAHAKFYAGILCNFVEILSGSFNFSSGPSVENLIYSRMSIDQFETNYLSHYGIEYNKTKDRQHFYYKSFGKRCFSDGYTIFRDELCDRVFFNK